MRKILLLFLILVLLSSCAVQPGISTSTESKVSNSESKTSIDNRPFTTKISMTVEGEKTNFTANLQTGSNGKYTIYVFNDPEQNLVFDFKTGKDGDMVTPTNQAEDSPSRKMYMRIVSSDGISKLPKNHKDENGFDIEYSRVTKGNNIFDVEIYYWNTPMPNLVTFMRSMLDTLVIK